MSGVHEHSLSWHTHAGDFGSRWRAPPGTPGGAAPAAARPSAGGDRRADRRSQRRARAWASTSRTSCRWRTGWSSRRRRETLAGHDVVFLALPHGASAEVAAQLHPTTVVIDCGADFRLADPAAWQTFYGSRPRRHLAVRAAGAARSARQAGRRPQRSPCPAATRPARPWPCCPPSSHGLTDAHDVVIVAASGPSGAGRSLKPHLLGSELMGSASAYGVGGVHRHTPELLQNFAGLRRRRADRSRSPRCWCRCPGASWPPAPRR